MRGLSQSRGRAKTVLIVERLQPYQGHDYMQLIRDALNMSKHRSLLTLRNFTSTEVVLDSAAKASEYEGWWQFIQPNELAFYVKRGDHDVRFLEKYNAVVALEYMLNGAKAVVWSFERYVYTGKSHNRDAVRVFRTIHQRPVRWPPQRLGFTSIPNPIR